MPELLDMLAMLSTAWKPGHTVGWRLERSISYEEFLTGVVAWRNLLRRTTGQAFALYLDDRIDFASALFGVWTAGKRVYLPGDALPATCACLREAVDGYLGEFASKWNPIVPAAQDKETHGGPFDRLHDDFVGLVLFTSGSTGMPQAIPKKLSQMSREVATLETEFGESLGGVDVICTVSHQHIYGLLFGVLWPFTAGRAIHARSVLLPQDLKSTLANRDGLLVSSPAHLKRLHEHPAWALMSNRLRAVFSSGGPLSLDVACNVKGLVGLVPIEVYGSSETGGIAWRQQNTRMEEAWTPMAGVRCRVDSTESVLEVRSSHLPDENWFRTADRAHFVADNRFLLKGRVDRLVKIEEKRISLTAIETGLTKCPLVANARVIVVEGRRPRTAAFIVPSVIGRNKLTEVGKLVFNRILRDALGQSIEAVGIPRIWRYLEALPTNAQGKTTHAALRALLDDGNASRPKLPLQRLLERDDQRAVLELTAPADLFYFDGHFPGVPVLAGVVQIQWVITCGRQCFDLPPVFCGIHGLKFQRTIAPDKPFVLELLHEPRKSCMSFKITSAVGIHSSGRVMFGASRV